MAIKIALAGNPNCGKTTMFNGISHPSIALRHTDGTLEMLRQFTCEDYFDRMD